MKEKKFYHVAARIDEDTKNRLDYICKAMHITVSEALRLCIQQGYCQVRINETTDKILGIGGDTGWATNYIKEGWDDSK